MLLRWLAEADHALSLTVEQQLLGTSLSAAELRVLTALAEGLSRREIAASLYLADGTVKAHLRRIYARLGAHSSAEAIARARERGLLER